jgi:hypothetical protein
MLEHAAEEDTGRTHNCAVYSSACRSATDAGGHPRPGGAVVPARQFERNTGRGSIGSANNSVGGGDDRWPMSRAWLAVAGRAKRDFWKTGMDDSERPTTAVDGYVAADVAPPPGSPPRPHRSSAGGLYSVVAARLPGSWPAASLPAPVRTCSWDLHPVLSCLNPAGRHAPATAVPPGPVALLSRLLLPCAFQPSARRRPIRHREPLSPLIGAYRQSHLASSPSSQLASPASFRRRVHWPVREANFITGLSSLLACHPLVALTRQTPRPPPPYQIQRMAPVSD